VSRDPRAQPGYDEQTIEQLVRDVADGWTMPPVRLDAPGWRERVRGPRARRIAAAGGLFGRLGQAATAAVTLTVAAALVAVILTKPPSEPGKSPEPSGDRPTATAGGNGTPLPKVYVPADAADPDPAVIVVRSERGDFARVDLPIGSISGPITGKSSLSEARVSSGGAMLCLCVAESGSIGDMPTDMIVTLEKYDARGKLMSSSPIERFSGEPDPRDASIFIPERPAHVLTSVSFSEDGRYGFVGWSLRAHPVWHSGVIVVDLGDGSIASHLDLPDMDDGEDDMRQVVNAPRVVATIDAGKVLIGRPSYKWTPPASSQATYTFGNDVFTASLDGGELTRATLAPTAGDCGGPVIRAGALPEHGYWVACSTDSPAILVRKLSTEGSWQGDVTVPLSPGVDTDPTAVSADGRSLYVWDPARAVLSRVDLASLDMTTGEGLAAAAASGPLDAFGDWLAPSVAAKSFLRGALAISPDGERVYAVGVKPSAEESERSGSTGIFVFDAATLHRIAAWQPTAAYVSLAVSPDGKLVYAAGRPNIDAAGGNMIAQQSSITVFDATDGSIRLIAGKLGGNILTFLSPTLN
jgi:hypothetical protein